MKKYTRKLSDDMFPLALEWEGSGWYAAGDSDDPADWSTLVVRLVDKRMSRSRLWLEQTTNRKGWGVAVWYDEVPHGYVPAPTMPWFYLWAALVVVRGNKHKWVRRYDELTGDSAIEYTYRRDLPNELGDLRFVTVVFEHGIPVRACITFDLGRREPAVYREWRAPRHMSVQERETWWSAAMLMAHGFERES